VTASRPDLHGKAMSLMALPQATRPVAEGCRASRAVRPTHGK